MLWFEDEIIVLLGTQQSHQLASVVTPCTMLNSAPKIGFPPAEVVIDINHRDAGLLRASFKSQELLRHRPCVSEQLICFGKIEIIDDVDQEQRDFVFVRRAAVQIDVFSWHRFLRTLRHAPTDATALPNRQVLSASSE